MTATQRLRDGRELVVREAEVEDAPAILNHLAAVSVETDFLPFGRGELELTLEEEQDFIDFYRESPVEVLLLGFVAGRLVSTLTFSGSTRPRLRHTGEFGLSVRRDHWGLGAGAAMIQALIGWARAGRSVTKLNARVRTDNERALQLLARLGFVREGTLSREIVIAGQYHGQHWLGLEL